MKDIIRKIKGTIRQYFEVRRIKNRMKHLEQVSVIIDRTLFTADLNLQRLFRDGAIADALEEEGYGDEFFIRLERGELLNGEEVTVLTIAGTDDLDELYSVTQIIAELIEADSIFQAILVEEELERILKAEGITLDEDLNIHLDNRKE